MNEQTKWYKRIPWFRGFLVFAIVAYLGILGYREYRETAEYHFELAKYTLNCMEKAENNDICFDFTNDFSMPIKFLRQ